MNADWNFKNPLMVDLKCSTVSQNRLLTHAELKTTSSYTLFSYTASWCPFSRSSLCIKWQQVYQIKPHQCSPQRWYLHSVRNTHHQFHRTGFYGLAWNLGSHSNSSVFTYCRTESKPWKWHQILSRYSALQFHYCTVHYEIAFRMSGLASYVIIVLPW